MARRINPRIYLMKSQVNKQGLCPVMVTVGDHKNLHIPGAKLPLEYWDQKEQELLPGSFEQREEVEQMILAYKDYLGKIDEYDVVPDDPEVIKSRLMDYKVIFKKIMSTYPLLETLEDYFERAHRDFAENSKEQYRNAIKKVLEFKPDIRAEDFADHDVWWAFKKWWSSTGLANQTFNGYFSCAFVGFGHWLCQTTGIPYQPLTKGQQRSMYFKAVSKPPMYLTDAELTKFKNVKCKNEMEERIRDGFLLQVYTGFRWSEIQTIVKVDDESFSYIYEKPEPHRVTHNWLPEGLELWKQHGEKIDWFVPTKYTYFLEKLKVLVKRAGINDEVSYHAYSGRSKSTVKTTKSDLFGTHGARRTFGHRWLQRGGTIRGLQGYWEHANLVTTERYLRLEKADVKKEMEIIKRNTKIK